MEQPEHPSSDLLAAYVERSLSPDEAARMEGHAADCPACRRLLRLLSASVSMPASSGTPRWWRMALAASLLLAVFALARGGRSAPSTVPLPVPGAAPLRPDPAAGSSCSGLEILPAAGGVCSLVSSPDGSPSVRLDTGGAWVTCPRGKKREIEMRTPAGSVFLDEGAEVWAEVVADPGTAKRSWEDVLLDAAHAGETPSTVRILVLEGGLHGNASGGSTEFGPGMLLLLRQGEPAVGREASPDLLGRLRHLRSQRLRQTGGWNPVCPSRVMLDRSCPSLRFQEPAPRHYRLLLRLEGRASSTEVAFLLPTPGGVRRWTAMLPSRKSGADSGLEVLFDGEVFRVRLDGICVTEIPASRLEDSLEGAEAGQGWGLQCWGGSVAVLDASTMELP